MSQTDLHLLRLLRCLRKQGLRPEQGAGAGRVTLPGPSGGVLCFRRATLEEARRAGLVRLSPDGLLHLSPGGRRRLVSSESLPSGEGDRTTAPAGALRINAAESPLALLARRKGKDGQPFLTAGEAEAGERLRRDCEKARLSPRLGPAWDSGAAAGRGGGARCGPEDLTAAAMDARRRVGRALDAAGPELSGLLLDVCFFLKGLEQVEMERQWPRRSAKLLLKTGLALLARHYGTVPRATRPSQAILHWGAEDFRPALRSGGGQDQTG